MIMKKMENGKGFTACKSRGVVGPIFHGQTPKQAAQQTLDQFNITQPVKKCEYFIHDEPKNDARGQIIGSFSVTFETK